MVTTILGSVLLFILFLSIIDVVKESLLFGMALTNATKYETTQPRMWMLALSIAYICTYIFA